MPALEDQTIRFPDWKQRMARLPRLHVPGGCYHVTLRGNHREAIFATARDRHVLNDIVADSIDRCDARIHAFCWMTNHLHMLIQIPDLPLGNIIRRIAQRYARYRHKQLRTGGHLFERRHGAQFVGTDSYFLTALKYIHFNPVMANLVANPSDYEWSSHRAFLGSERIPWLTTDFGLSLFSRDRLHAQHAYRQFMAQTLSAEEQDLVGDSLDGTPRTLGTDRYLEKVGNMPPTYGSTGTLSDLVDRICAEYGTTPEQLASPVRVRAISSVRAELASRAIDGRIASLTEVARFLRRDPSSVCRLLERRGRGRGSVTPRKRQNSKPGTR